MNNLIRQIIRSNGQDNILDEIDHEEMIQSFIYEIYKVTKDQYVN